MDSMSLSDTLANMSVVDREEAPPVVKKMSGMWDNKDTSVIDKDTTADKERLPTIKKTRTSRRMTMALFHKVSMTTITCTIHHPEFWGSWEENPNRNQVPAILWFMTIKIP